MWQKPPAEALPPIPKCGCSKLPPFQPGSKIKLTKEKGEYQKKEKKEFEKRAKKTVLTFRFLCPDG